MIAKAASRARARTKRLTCQCFGRLTELTKYHSLPSEMMLRRLNGGLRTSICRLHGRRNMADLGPRPGPIPLPKEEQEEFERLQREAMSLSTASAPKTVEEFEGDTNPVTGEVGGPKQDPLRHGDYSFNGRVTDF